MSRARGDSNHYPVILMRAQALLSRRKPSNCLDADYPDSADEAFQRSSPEDITSRSIGDAFVPRPPPPDYPCNPTNPR